MTRLEQNKIEQKKIEQNREKKIELKERNISN